MLVALDWKSALQVIINALAAFYSFQSRLISVHSWAEMKVFDAELQSRLAVLQEQGLYRQLRRVESPQTPRLVIDGKTFLNFSSNDYLGLADEPVLKAAAVESINKYGAGSGASRLICGSLAVHHELESALCAFKGTEAALAFSSGYATAVGTICALMDKDDVIVLDKLVHASIVDAARLSGAKLRVFAHNDLNDLESILRWANGRPKTSTTTRQPRALVVTESVFSMDGDHAPLREMVVLKEKFGAWLMVDEAHAVGLYGKSGRGLADELGVAQEVEIQMGTLGKALGSAGGYICGSRPLIDYLINRARSFIFSTAPVPAAAAAATAAIGLVIGEFGDRRREHLWSLVNTVCPNTKHIESSRSVIVPIHIGDETAAMEAAASLREQGIFIPAIRYPTVARGKARLRLTLSAAHTKAEVAQLLAALERLHITIN